MQKGDWIVYPIKGSREILVGQISGPYRWEGQDKELLAADYANLRPVAWKQRVPRIAFSPAALHSFGSFSSVSSSDEFLDEVVAAAEETATPKGKSREVSVVSADLADSTDSDESIDLATRAEEETADYLLRQWSRTGQDFEETTAALLRAMGYSVRVQSGTHDLGVDVIAHPDPLGVQAPILKVQAKSGTNAVGAPAVKQLRGLLNQGEKGVLVSLGGFSNDAKHVQQNDANLVLIDGARFVELFLEFYDRLEPSVRHKYPLKRVYAYAP